MKKIKLTKEQNEYLKEAVNVTVNTGATNGNLQQAVQNAKTEVQKSGINPNKVGYNIPAQESVCYTKKQLKEARTRNAIKNSERFTKKQLDKILKRNIKR